MTEPTDKQLEDFAVEEQFLLFCDVDEFTQIARAVLAKWGTPPAVESGIKWQCGPQASGFTAPQTDSQPARDERDDFEKTFPRPSGCIRCGTGYASTDYSNWAAHTHVERWEGWQARAALEGKSHGLKT